jgi:glycerate kinase
MKIILAPDSFKECASAQQVAEAMAAGVRRALPDADCVLLPMADGGEGTVDALVAATGGCLVTTKVTGPLGEAVDAAYGVLGDGQAAAIEMAAASGLNLVPPGRRDPRLTTTRGTGELMRNAIDAGMRRLIVGLGGSATNDGGAGMAQALGYQLRDASGKELAPGGAALASLASIDTSDVRPDLAACTVRVACDVDNPLCGRRGASKVYGPQKGATPAMTDELDAALAHYGGVLEATFNREIVSVPGAGAAGGLGAGLIAFTNGVLEPGFDIIAAAVGLAEQMQGAALCITGEGRIDGQSVHGKTPVGVARYAQAGGVPTIAIAGSLGDGYEAVYEHGITKAVALRTPGMPLEDALRDWESLMVNAVVATVRDV